MSTPYLSWVGHGAASLAPPGVFSGAKGWAFTIDADRKAMQSLADALLNPAGNGQVRYEAVFPAAMLSFLDIARCTSSVDQVGWLPGRECAIWVPLLERRLQPNPGVRLVLWSPYIFITYTIGMQTGREVWGWPKVLARIGVAGDTPGHDEFFCTTTLFRTLQATTRGEDAVLYRVVRTDPGAAAGSPLLNAATAAADVLGHLFGGVAGQLLDLFKVQPTLPCIALKQVRSAENAKLACFQAIVESPVAITSFTGAGLLTGSYAVEITTCASHPIVADLIGRPPDPVTTTLPVRAAAWLSGDITALPGRNIVVGT